MKRCAILLTALAASGAFYLAAPAQAPRQEKRPATPRPGRQPMLVSPEVHPDRRVTFRFRAPKAERVAVAGEWGGGEKPLTRDEQGVWSVTVGPLEPDVYGYSFVVNGFLRTLDPSNGEVKPMRSPQTSVVEVPGDPPRVWEFQDVPHGTVRVHAYHSKSLGKRRGLSVYTPPGYDRDAGRKYPVLYLLHGSGDSEATWTAFGRAHWILDNLLAQKKARPMIVVMPNGHAAPARPPAQAEDRRARTAAFERDLLEDVLPFVEAHYRVQQEPGGRAVAGLSMGGGQSLSLGLNHPEVFGWVGAFSSAVFEPERTLAKAFDNPKATNDRLRLFWIACGKQDFLMDRNREFDAALRKHGIRHEFHETEGNHSWPVWRRYLAQFAPLLFQAEK